MAISILDHFLDIVTIIVMTIIMVFESIHYRLFVRNSITTANEENVTGKVVVITGGSRGMGKASAKELASRGAVVVIGDVNVKEGQETVDEIQRETGNNNVTILHLDLSSMKSVEEFAKKVSNNHPKIKILLNNAGIGGVPKDNKKTKDGFNFNVSVNYLGHFLLTNLLLENLKRENNSRVVSMSSSMQLLSHLDVDDLMMDKSGFGLENGLPYCNTKFCNALFTKELAKRVAGTGIKTYALCPGLVNTRIYETAEKTSQIIFSLLMKPFGVSPEVATYEFILHCVLDKSIENESGKMYRFRRPFYFANRRLDEDLARNLWEKSSTLVKLNERMKNMK